MAATKKPVPHGTTSGYKNNKCRCEECRTAWNKYCAEYKARRRAKFDFSAPGVEHGAAKTYQIGCRCAECRSAHASYKREKSYALSSSAYTELLAAQQGLCACCGRKRKLVVDHIHGTSTVRGLLCTSCNTGIGKLGDNTEGLEKALKYLRASET